ncbi:FAD-dependent oxidoreductase [Salinibacterium sp. G-O1]|uniref:NAD(P)/FAD-dependent oxidoreductase n=1 Tax=Salinibacterium sp. G-O1 TaxID=3046208 RepID=UPI0024B969FE|nr:FAD-dependent oxidoreductase [Salinibacterium sp. G-O1]MDJ0334693.1 FAD-dependent oxidoreductase [Salinibacterium sp. G-O1]
MTDYRGLSFWHDTVPDDLTPRPPLGGDVDVDVAIVGGGLTGLWTAWYLLERDPSLSIAVIEKDIVGFGASGRNGGWCSALFPRSTASLERAHGRDAALAMRRAMIGSVDEVGRVAASIGLDIDFVRGGTVSFARSKVQLAAARAEVAEARSFGVDSIELWGQQKVKAAGALGATFDPACARLHPGKLVRGLARALETRGVRIYESTEVLDYAAHTVTTTHGTVRSDKLVVATEGYGATLPATRRSVLPLYSLMIATEPLPDATWREIGIEHGQTFTDFRHLLVYGQRTADNRFAFGGRGARYHWGSAIRPQYDRAPAVFDHLRRTLGEMFPVIGDVPVTHRWGGPLGVARDWHATASYDAARGVAWAGGYVGDGLSTTNLAGRTLADLMTATESALTKLPWVNHRSPSWEPEPLRFLGANAGLLAMTVADAEERVTGRASVAAKLMGPLTGH